MSNSGDDRLRSAWSNQTDRSLDVDPANAEANLRRRQAEVARRDRIAYLSAAIVGPSWLAALWLMPDLRLPSATGLLIAVWVTWQLFRRSAARLPSASTDLPCLEFQRALLQRERDLARSQPKWHLLPLAVGQVAIAATLATNPRFTGSQFFREGLVLFGATAGVVLVVAWRRSQREALALERELEAIGAASEGDRR
jgi:hypothetical protein